MLTEELYRTIEQETPDYSKFHVNKIIDWGYKQGQGKRCGDQVMGSMCDLAVRNIVTYHGFDFNCLNLGSKMNTLLVYWANKEIWKLNWFLQAFQASGDIEICRQYIQKKIKESKGELN